MWGKLRMAVGVALTFPMLILSIFYALVPAWILRVCGGKKAQRRWIVACSHFTSNYLLWTFGVSVKVSGKENLPPALEGKRLCFISNHQSNLDIPVLFGKGHVDSGVITKTEIRKVPVLNWWCKEMQCIYISRKSVRSSIKAILDGVNDVKGGLPMLIFPEGTRSKTGEVGEFKAGSFNLATRADAIIIPIALNGTRHGFEVRKRWHVNAQLHYCKPVDTSLLDAEGKKTVHTVVEEEIRVAHDWLEKENG